MWHFQYTAQYMKVYHRSIFKHFIFWGFFLPLTIFFIDLRLTKGPFNIYVISFVICFYILALIMATGFNYIILDDDRITVKNSFYRFWSLTLPYQDIKKIIINNDIGSHSLYFRFETEKKVSRYYILECLGHSNLKNVVRKLRKHDVKMDIAPAVTKFYL